MAGEIDELDDFYTVLKSGTTVASFLKRYGRIIRFIHAEGLTEDYRLVHRHRRMIHPTRLQKIENICKFPIFVNVPKESVH